MFEQICLDAWLAILVHLMLNLLYGSLVSLKELYVNFCLMNWLKVLISISQDVEDQK